MRSAWSACWARSPPSMPGMPNAPPLLAGTGKDAIHLLVVATSDRGLAGGFNATILREARRARSASSTAAGKTVKILTVGRKGRDALRRDYAPADRRQPDRCRPAAPDVRRGARHRRSALLALFEAGEFDVCTIVYNRFRSAMTQIVTAQQLIPFAPPEGRGAAGAAAARGVYEFEPDEEEILDELLPRNLAVQIFTALLENAASEQGARMTAMDNATRNAGDMIDRLDTRTTTARARPRSPRS